MCDYCCWEALWRDCGDYVDWSVYYDYVVTCVGRRDYSVTGLMCSSGELVYEIAGTGDPGLGSAEWSVSSVC